MLRFITDLTNKHKILRGMISYGLLWPAGCLLEQTLVEKRTFRNYDWKKCLNFSLFGAFIMGPTIYLWMSSARTMWPRTDIKSSLSKAITEQVAYDPFAISAFLFCMSIMEGRTYEEAKIEVRNKFFDAYRIGIIYWPCVQTINFALVHPRNQVVFTSFFSMCWSTILAYIKYLQMECSTEDIEHHHMYLGSS